ncbi:MAG TPA: AI-2E family transporter, partial [Microbacterium sp.]|nr:AI-2E family transporter [Microbacterium sp.]
MKRPAPAPAAPAPPALSPSLRIVIGLAASVIVLVGLSIGRDVVGPLVLGAVIVIICQP